MQPEHTARSVEGKSIAGSIQIVDTQFTIREDKEMLVYLDPPHPIAGHAYQLVVTHPKDCDCYK